MEGIKTIVHELFGLFVDDGSFALAIIIWAAIAGLALPRLDLPAEWSGPILFTGLALILVESAIRRSRQ